MRAIEISHSETFSEIRVVRRAASLAHARRAHDTNEALNREERKGYRWNFSPDVSRSYVKAHGGYRKFPSPLSRPLLSRCSNSHRTHSST